jgi:thioredoxin:protein disulfide reductase
MTGVKRACGLALLGVAIWIVAPVLQSSFALALWGAWLVFAGALLLPFAKPAPSAARRKRWLPALAGLAAVALGVVQWVGAATGASDPLRPLARLVGGAAGQANAMPQFRAVRSVAELDAILRRPGQAVMLDFYADWCVSCKQMERFTFTDPAVAAKMARALLLKADVTANSDDDKALLKRFHLFGPPGTIFFDALGREHSGARVIGFQDANRFAQTLSAVGL